MYLTDLMTGYEIIISNPHDVMPTALMIGCEKHTIVGIKPSVAMIFITIIVAAMIAVIIRVIVTLLISYCNQYHYSIKLLNTARWYTTKDSKWCTDILITVRYRFLVAPPAGKRAGAWLGAEGAGACRPPLFLRRAEMSWKSHATADGPIEFMIIIGSSI